MKIYLVIVVLMSMITFVAYGWDKRRAVAGQSRISERRLHWLALLGGWPGALLGQRLFRHKTIKLSFRMVLWLIVAVHVFAIGGWIYWSM